MQYCTIRFRQGVVGVPLLCILAASSSLGQRTAYDGAGTHGKKMLRAVRTELPVVVDGNLDEPAWLHAPISLGLIQKDPQEGEPSTERTEFRVIYTSQTLYIGIICYDSSPQGILATERRRDNKLENDDTLSIVLDTFHDHRNSYLFRTNPLGIQYDALVTDEGNDINASWDEQWEVASRITETGWVAEFAIPFKSLRMAEGNGHVLGLDLERVIRRKNEFSYWNNFHRGFSLEDVSQGGHLTGIEDIETGLRLRIKPYLLGGFTQSVRPTPSGPDPFRTVTKNASDLGIEVMKYRITPSLTADFTWNTDFAQTEVDDQQVNLDRFPLFFPEKREFFQEGAGIFEFGIVRGEGPQAIMKLFHSRQIGLSPGRLPVPIVAGGRMTGKVAGLTLGLLNVQTEAFEPESIPASNYSVVRVKRDVLARSNLGAYFLNREKAATNDYNRVFGVDANFVFFRYLNVGGLLARSAEPNVKEDNWTSSGGINWNSDFFGTGVSWIFVEPDFRDDIGFVPRKNMRRLTPYLQFLPRPRSRLIRQLQISARSEYTMNQNYELETRVNHYNFTVRFQRGDSIGFLPHTHLESIRQPFAIRPGVVVIPAGTYSWWYPRIMYTANPAKSLSGTVIWQSNLGFWGGNMTELTLTPRLKLNEQASIEVAYEINKATFLQKMCVQNIPECGFTDHIVNTRVNYNFNNRWLTSTIIQYNNADSFLGVNFRLNYIFRPGDDFFLIYNEGRRVGGSFDGQKDRSLQAKLTYSFDF